MGPSLLLPFLLLLSLAAAAQPGPEICDNALDDDQDGLIDLRDPDCACDKPLIPNGSFEEADCCPNAPSQDVCIRHWGKATLSTPDYLNTCDWTGWEQFPVPLPLPDGQACVGFRNGRFESRLRPGEKEYIGICLEHPLKAETTYRFRFFVGFSDAGHSPATELVFYGTADCRFFPAGIDRPDLVCPGNEPGWFEIKRVAVSGSNTWKTYEFEYTPEEPVAAIGFGPGCELATSRLDLYYFFDNLVVEEEPPIPLVITADGPPCSAQFALEVARDDNLRYQWYRDGVAVVGETTHRLRVGGRDGGYQVAVYRGDDCRLTPPYLYTSAAPAGEIAGAFCAGEAYDFHGRRLTEPGVYQDTLRTPDGCDSIVRLTLAVRYPETDSLRVRVFAGESFRLGEQTYRRPGRYEVRLPREPGCDSLIVLDLGFFDIYFPNAFSPNGDGLNDRFTVFGGPELARIAALTVFDRWGAVVWSARDLPPNDDRAGWDGRFKGQLLPQGVYVYSAVLELSDGSRRERAGEVLVVR